MKFLILVYLSASVVFGSHLHMDLKNQAAQPVSSMQRLHRTLLANYSRQIRPVSDNFLPVPMNVSIKYAALLSVNNIQQEIHSLLFLNLYWKDHFLQWDPSDYDGIDRFFTSTDDIWGPDLCVNNAKDDSRYFTNAEKFLSVRYDGRVHWSPGKTSTTMCSLDMTFFPFDTQRCEVRFLFSQDSRELELDQTIVFAETVFQENGEWTILNVYGKTVSRTIGGDLFTPVYVYVELQRRPFFYVMTVLFPMMMLSVLSSCSFCVSGASGEKLTFALTVLLSQTVLSSFTSTLLPTTSDEVPLIILYVFAVLLHNTACVLAVVYSISVFTRTKPHTAHLGPFLSLVLKLSRGGFCSRALPRLFSLYKAHGKRGVAEIRNYHAGREGVDNTGDSLFTVTTPYENIHMSQKFERAVDVWIEVEKSRDPLGLAEIGRAAQQDWNWQPQRVTGLSGQGHGDETGVQSWAEVSKVLDRFFLIGFWLSNVAINLTYFFYVAMHIPRK